ncbi:MAG: hypothetical protein NC213_03335 [Acetobacter sp.]|nr:hypothetical protein [Bacteroides sp.]MCM1340756.1 hypothetical protein [Acetobacter sp.]MCM1432687.1 hypothetical protein [Clostridiales bacterium]
MPKLIDYFTVTELVSVKKISDMDYKKWKWREQYLNYQCELFIFESEEKRKGERYLYFTDHHNYLKTYYGTYKISDNIITMTTQNSIYKFKIIHK